MKHLIIYHFEDNDGVCSCALVKHYLTEHGVAPDDIDLLPSNYVSLAKLVTERDFDDVFDGYDEVWMVDISFNDWTYMKRLYDKFGVNFIWCDHHAPIIKDSIEHGFDSASGFRDIGRSAILCVYRHLYEEPFQKEAPPTLLRLLSAWDCWSWVKEGLDENFIRAFNAGMSNLSELNVDYYLGNMRFFLRPGLNGERKYPYDNAEDVNMFILTVLGVGEKILEKQDKMNESLILGYGELGWKVDGVENAVMIVTSGPTNSQMFKCVCDKLDHGICFKHSKEGKWIVSLYNTRNDVTFDCGAYLRQKYGGGGHVGAAGCTLSDEQFFKVIWEKNL